MGVDFYTEHKRILDQKGFVWFCRFGKNNMKIEKITSCERIVIIKESGKAGKYYAAEYDDLQEKTPSDKTAIPPYYTDMDRSEGYWLRLTGICEVEADTVMNCFVSDASQGSIAPLIRSMCPAFYIICKSKVSIN